MEDDRITFSVTYRKINVPLLMMWHLLVDLRLQEFRARKLSKVYNLATENCFKILSPSLDFLEDDEAAS